VPTDTDRRSGKQAYWTFNSVTVPITKMSPKITRKLGDTTDSGDYDDTGDMLPTTQIPVGYTIEAGIEGRFRINYMPALLSLCTTSATQIEAVIGIAVSPTSVVWGSGLFDISDFATDIPVDDIVNYTANIKSYGIFTTGPIS
jgi:hypothetical protein